VIVDAREQRGLEIAAKHRIEKRGASWLVPAQSKAGTYRVTMTPEGPSCTCPDYELRGTRCKHGFAVEIVIRRETVTETTVDGDTRTTVTETAAVRLSYPQKWTEYNRAQTAEQELFRHLLRDLAATVPEPVQEKGRPRIPMADAIFCAGYKVYSTVSSRRFMTDLRDAHAAGLVSKAWHFNSVLGCIENPELTPILYDLVTASAAPLAAVEDTFAVDSTGFGCQQYYRHYAVKYGKEMFAHDWLKLHALVGCRTNVIAAVQVTDRNAGDCPQFVPLLNIAAPTFTMEAVCGDKAYASRLNVRHVTQLGGTPYIALKSNNVPYATQQTAKHREDVSAWQKLWHLYNLHRDEFLAKYHARSNAESTFSAMKRVFGDTLRNKGRVAQENELLLKVIAFNITCLIHSIFELGVEVPGLSGCTQKAFAAHKVAG
jgi:transposase